MEKETPDGKATAANSLGLSDDELAQIKVLLEEM